MKVQKEKQASGAVVLTLKGEFDTAVVPAFNEIIDGLLAAGDSRVVLNMLRVKFLNSTAIGSLIRAHKACGAAGGSLAVSQPSEAVREPIELIKLDAILSIHDGDNEALEAVG